MVKKYYYCNLCADEKQPKELMCIYYNSTIKKGDSFGAYEFVTNINATEKHICKDCFKLVFEFVEQNKKEIYGNAHI